MTTSGGGGNGMGVGWRNRQGSAAGRNGARHSSAGVVGEGMGAVLLVLPGMAGQRRGYSRTAAIRLQHCLGSRNDKALIS